ncbi:DUF4172 domain-containing protein [Muricauda sp. SCSIO 65647]|nr:DUF4172 domain-containing protein [Muricauda sp. SCSIO 65647]
MVSEAIKTSEIEGEYLSRNDVMSSLRRNLGLKPELPLTEDKRAEGVDEARDMKSIFEPIVR